MSSPRKIQKMRNGDLPCANRTSLLYKMEVVSVVFPLSSSWNTWWRGLNQRTLPSLANTLTWSVEQAQEGKFGARLLPHSTSAACSKSRLTPTQGSLPSCLADLAWTWIRASRSISSFHPPPFGWNGPRWISWEEHKISFRSAAHIAPAVLSTNSRTQHESAKATRKQN